MWEELPILLNRFPNDPFCFFSSLFELELFEIVGESSGSDLPGDGSVILLGLLTGVEPSQTLLDEPIEFIRFARMEPFFPLPLPPFINCVAATSLLSTSVGASENSWVNIGSSSSALSVSATLKERSSLYAAPPYEVDGGGNGIGFCSNALVIAFVDEGYAWGLDAIKGNPAPIGFMGHGI